MKVVQRGRLVLEASTGQGETTTATYKKFGDRGAGQTAQITQQVLKLSFKENGRVLWEAKQVAGAPVVVQIKKGQSIDSALAAEMKPNVAFFSNTPIPQYVARQAENGAYGASTLTPQGLQPPVSR